MKFLSFVVLTFLFFFFQAEDGIRDWSVTGVQTCALPICLQYPVCVFGILRAGYVVVNVNPLYTARELEHQLKDSGSEVIVILENFAHVLQQVIARTPAKHVVVAALGDLLGAKGAIVNFVVRRVKKMVPRWEIPGAIRFNAMIAEGERLEL